MQFSQLGRQRYGFSGGGHSTQNESIKYVGTKINGEHHSDEGSELGKVAEKINLEDLLRIFRMK